MATELWEQDMKQDWASPPSELLHQEATPPKRSAKSAESTMSSRRRFQNTNQWWSFYVQTTIAVAFSVAKNWTEKQLGGLGSAP